MIQRHIGRAIPYLDTELYVIIKDGWTDGDIPIPDELIGVVVMDEFFYWYSYTRVIV